MMAERQKVEEDASEAVKAALVISGADKTRFGWLKQVLANNYLLGTDQYPDTYKKAMRILGNYQTTKTNRQPDAARQREMEETPAEEEMVVRPRQDQETQ